MNKLTKFLAATAVATLAFAMPVLANPSNPLSAVDTSQLEQLLNSQAASTMVAAAQSMATQVDPAVVQNHIDEVAKQVAALDADAVKNHLDYLQKVVNNSKETARVKQEVVTNYEQLAKVNPQYASMIADAQAELTKALSDQAAAEKALADAKVELAKYLQ